MRTLKYALAGLVFLFAGTALVHAQDEAAAGGEAAAAEGADATGGDETAGGEAAGEATGEEGGGSDEFQSGSMEEMEVTGQAEYTIDDAKKPITDVTLKPFEPIDSLISDREHALEKRLPSSVEKDLVNVIKLHNPFLRQPVYPVEVVNEVTLDVRKPRKKVDMWKIEIYNSGGKLVRTYEGKGNPPKQITWDGKNDNGKPVLTPGELYHYRITLARKSGAERKNLSEPFEVNGYWYEDNGTYGIIVSTSLIFQNGREEFTDGAEERLIEVLNVVKKYYTGQNLIEVKVYSHPQFLAEARCDAVESFFLKNAPLDPEKMTVNPGFFSGTGPRYERLEVKFR